MYSLHLMLRIRSFAGVPPDPKTVDAFAHNRAALRHRPAGLSVWTKTTGAVAAPVSCAHSLRPPFNKLKKSLGACLMRSMGAKRNSPF